MQPLRGYDSFSLGDLLQGIVPAPLSSPNMPGPWDADPDSLSMMAAQANPMLPRQNGITRDSMRALKQAMARIAPYVPPQVLQQHYIRRLAELSNPTPETLYPVGSYDTPLQAGDLLSGIQPAPLSPPNMPSAMDSPFVREAMARFATSPAANDQVQPVRAADMALPIDDLTSGITPASLSAPNMPSVMNNPFVRAGMARFATSGAANGQVQPVHAGDALFSTGDLTSSISPAPLSAADMPSAMDSPFVRAAMARLAASPAADGQVQPVRADKPALSIGDLTRSLTPAPLSPPNMPSVTDSPLARADDASILTSGIRAPRLLAPNRLKVTNPMATVYPMQRQPEGSVGEPGLVESMVPLWGSGKSAIYHLENGHPILGAIDTGLFALDAMGLEGMSEPLKLAIYGSAKGLYKGVPKALQKTGTAAQWKQLKRSVMLGLAKELRGYVKFGSHDFDNAVRRYYARYLRASGNPLPKDMPVHHWAIPQRLDWLFPKWLINQPWNLLPLTRVTETEAPTARALHDAIEGKGKTVFQFDKNDKFRNYLMRYEYGTPEWAKRAIPAYLISGVGNAAEIGSAVYDYLYRNDDQQ